MQLRCTSPRTVGFKADGKSLSWSPKDHNKQYATFQLPCGKCLNCRLEYARQWAVRCVHEAQMHEKNSFITLTYSDENLKSPKLIYEDWQLFAKKLRRLQNDPIGMLVTGEYGEKTKRPHWHAILFGWGPPSQTRLPSGELVADAYNVRTNDTGDRCFSSKTLDRTWGLGKAEIGDVNFRSAGYCARYSLKKLSHGRDQDHDLQPISKKSSKYAIGKKFLEKYWQDIFNYGQCILKDGTSTGIPRYYEKWLKENHADAWLCYVTETKQKIIEAAQKRDREIQHEQALANWERRHIHGDPSHQISPNETKKKITEINVKKLRNFAKF